MRIDWKKLAPARWIELSSPVTLGFAALALAALLLGTLTGGATTRLLFSAYRSSWASPLFYLRLFLHIFGHVDFSHYAANMSLLLVLGPLVEKHYGWRRYLTMILLTALATALVHLLLSSGTAILGASGVVFMLVFLAAISGRASGKIPLTLVLVAVIYLGQELVGGLLGGDNVSHLAHIAGALCGIAFGLSSKKSL